MNWLKKLDCSTVLSNNKCFGNDSHACNEPIRAAYSRNFQTCREDKDYSVYMSLLLAQNRV